MPAVPVETPGAIVRDALERPATDCQRSLWAKPIFAEPIFTKAVVTKEVVTKAVVTKAVVTKAVVPVPICRHPCYDSKLTI